MIPYGTWVPVAVRLLANCYTPFIDVDVYRHGGGIWKSGTGGSALFRQAVFQYGTIPPTRLFNYQVLIFLFINRCLHPLLCYQYAETILFRLNPSAISVSCITCFFCHRRTLICCQSLSIEWILWNKLSHKIFSCRPTSLESLERNMKLHVIYDSVSV